MLDGLRKRLEKAKGAKVDEFPHILWAYRTTPRRPTRLTYETKAIILLEAGLPTMRNTLVNEGLNDDALRTELDLEYER